ncbi:B-cell receptor CD22-like, partial [Silurus asotus]
DSGEYKCMCSNEVGHQNSTSVTLNVLYPPKNLSVSISPSGEIVERLVNLTCSSDSNPPVETYTWFKENGTSPVGSGQSYRALQSGLYYCEVQNKLGSERAAAVSITINGTLDNKLKINPNTTLDFYKANLESANLSVSGKESWYSLMSGAARPPHLPDSVRRLYLSRGLFFRQIKEIIMQRNCFSALLGIIIDSPKLSVSISPSDEIVEGSSATLTCSSDANPPATCEWYKGTKLVRKIPTYTIAKVSSEDGGEYKCKCHNKVGHQYSNRLTLNVLSPSHRVSMSISISSNILEGSSLTLTCGSDANPPVETYEWFKEKQSSPVGSGQSYRALQNVQYYCKVLNKLGSVRSATVSITINGEVA